MALIALVVVVALVALVATRADRTPSATGTDPAPAEEQSQEQSQEQSNAQSQEQSNAQSQEQSNEQSNAPGNWVSYEDPQTGFTIAHPPTWTVSTNGTLTDFRDPDTRAYLRVDHVQPPGPSPEGAWYTFESRFAAENSGYQRIQITPTTFKGYRAAIWEFTYTSRGVTLHAVDLGFVTGEYGFALNFQARAEDWDRMQPIFEAFKESFKAPA